MQRRQAGSRSFQDADRSKAAEMSRAEVELRMFCFEFEESVILNTKQFESSMSASYRSLWSSTVIYRTVSSANVDFGLNR